MINKLTFRTDEELDDMILSIMELRGYSTMSALMRKLIMDEDERLRAGDRECSIIQIPMVKGFGVRVQITPCEDRAMAIYPEVKEASQATDFLKMYPHAKCDEHCGECDADVSIPAYRRSFCPECGEPILPCSMCSVSMQLNACGTPECPYFKEEEE